MSSQLKRPLGPLSQGKENSQVSQNNHRLDTGETGSQATGKLRKTNAQDSFDDKKRGLQRKQPLPQRAHTTLEDEDYVRADSKKTLKVFEYQVMEQQSHIERQRDSRREEEAIQKVTEYLKDQQANFNSAHLKIPSNSKGANFSNSNKVNSNKQAGNQTALDLRILNEDLRGFKMPELNTISNSNRAVAKSKTRPETQLQKSTAGRHERVMPEGVTQERAIGLEFSQNTLNKEIVGRKVGAPNLVVTSHLSKEDDLFSQERQRELMVLDLIATNIVNQNTIPKQSLSPKHHFLPDKQMERKRKNDSKLQALLPGARQNKHSEKAEKAKASKSQDQIRQMGGSKYNLTRLAAMKSKQKQVSLLDYLDSSLAGQEPPLQTLNILTATGGQFLPSKARDKSKSVVANTITKGDMRKRSNEKDKSLVLTNQINLQASNKKSNSQDKKRNRSHSKKSKKEGRDSSNSRSRSRDALSKEASRDKNLGRPTTSHDSNLRKKQLKASNNLLAMINLAKKQKQSVETVNLKNQVSSGKKKSVDTVSGSSQGLFTRKVARANQSLSPKNLADRYKADVPKQIGRSQNLLSKHINIGQAHAARSAPGFHVMASIEIQNSLDRDFVINNTDETISIFRQAKQALDRANQRKQRKKSQSLVDDQGSQVKKKSRSPPRDKLRTGASKIDKLIRDNLKKQIRKDLELKEKERQLKLEQKRRKLELEQANERMRRQNENQVLKSKEKLQKLQMQKQLQQNLTNSGLTSTVPLNEKTLDQNLKNVLARTEKDEITAEMTKLLAQIDERPQLQKRLKPKVRPIDANNQLATQKFDEPNKLEQIEQLESMLENQSYLNADSDAFLKNHELAPSQGESQLIGKNVSKKEESAKEKSFAQEKARDHRRSNGLDFIDMRKEIISELKQLGNKFKAKVKKADRQLKATLQNADMEENREIQELLVSKPVASGFTQLRGSISQRQLIDKVTGGKPSKPIRKPLISQKKAESIFQAITKDQPKQELGSENNHSFNEPEVKQKKQFSLDISKLLERASMQQEQSQAAPMKKEIIRKFMKEKQRQMNDEAEKQKQQELKKTLKVHQNLVKLNNYCKKQLLNTTGRGQGIQLTSKITVPNVILPKAPLRVKNGKIKDAKKSELELIEANELTVTPNRMLFEDSEPSLNVSGTRISRGVSAAEKARKEVSRSKAADTTDDLYEDSKMQSLHTLEERPLRMQQRQGAKRQNKFTSGLAPCFEKSSSAKTLRAQMGKKSQSPPKPADAIKKANQSLITANTQKVNASAKDKKLRRVKNRKRGKSITKGSGGPTVYMQQGVTTSKAVPNQRLNVKVPNMSRKRCTSSVGTLESQDDESYRGRSGKRHRISQSRITSSAKKQRQSQAAVRIQREVRKYLQRLGFYEAKEIMSPDREPMINLFIEKKVDPVIQVRPAQKPSKSRSGSRSSSKKAFKAHRPSDQPSRQSPSRQSKHQKASPDAKETFGKQHAKAMQRTTIIAEISGYKQKGYLLDGKASSQSDEHETIVERTDHLGSELGTHARIQSMQILDSSNYASAKSGTRVSNPVQSSPEDDQPIESGRIINLNKVQVLPNFSKMNFLDTDDQEAQSPKTKKAKKVDKQKKPKVKKEKKKAFAYQPKADVPVSESASILDRLQGTSAANNFNKDEESNAFLPKKQAMFEKQLPALLDKKDRNDAPWAPSAEQMKSVQTPRSGINIPYPDSKSHQSMSLAQKSGSDNDPRRIQMSVESKKSSKNEHDAVSQSSSSVFDRNAFQQFASTQKNQVMQNSDYQKLIKFREDALKMREHKEKRHIQKLLKNNQCSPRTYHAKKEQIDRWVHIERMEIEKTKVTFQQEWDKTVKMIEETQKSVDQIRSKINVQSNQNSNNAQVSSLTSGQKQMHGSSVNGSAKKQSILIEDPPKSYRSNHIDPTVQPIERASALSSHRSATYGQPAENLMQYLEKRLASQQEALTQARSHDRAESERILGRRLSNNQEDELEQSRHSRYHRVNSESSDYSQQPSAEFLERLEKVKRQEQELMNLNAHLDEPELHFDQDLDDKVDHVGEYAPGLDVQENDFKEPYTDLKIQESLDIDEDDSAKNVRITEIINRHTDPTKQDIPSFNFEPYLKTEPNFLNEPAIISNGVGKYSTEDENLVQAKLRTAEPDFLTQIKDPERREDIADLLTESIIESLLKDCVALPPSRAEKSKRDEEEKDSNVDVFVIDSQLRDKEEKKEWIEIRQRHLIENDLVRIDQYINEIVESLLQFEIDFSSEDSEAARNQQDNYHIQFLKQLTQPILKEPTEILQALQTSEIGSYKHFETTQDLQKHPIIPVDLYLDIEKAREEAMIIRKGPNINRETQLVWESIHIQNKSFFDAVNESLMKFRPYGLTGEPMPWSNKIRRLQTKVDISSVDTERLFQMVKQEVFRWAQTYCGCLPSPIFAFPSHKVRGQEDFSNELFQEFREKRQTQVLWTETVEQEHHWLNFDYEEAQVKIDLSDMILEHLVDELVDIMAGSETNVRPRNPPPSSPMDQTPTATNPESLVSQVDFNTSSIRVMHNV